MHLTVDDSKNVQISNVKIIAPKDSPNTDGIHVSGSTNVVIKNSVISTGNQPHLIFFLSLLAKAQN